MTKLDLLKVLQKEFVGVLENRAKLTHIDSTPRNAGKTKLKRLRLQIQELMLEIERSCDFAKYNIEEWEKDYV